MNILFLTFTKIDDINERGIYSDLARNFVKNGHSITIVSPLERREKKKTVFVQKENYNLLLVNGLNYRNTNIFEKTAGFLATEYQYYFAVKKYLYDVKFDLIFYSTPPITFLKAINYIKNRDQAFAYLLLKDIFPQNAVDLKMMRKNSILFNYFRKKEKKLYEISDAIGCLSQKNLEYIKENNPSIPYSKLEINPNSIEPLTISITDTEKEKIRIHYNLPKDKKIAVFCGNFGKPQGIEFLIECVENYKKNNLFFLIVGDGTEIKKIKKWSDEFPLKNNLVLYKLPKKEFDTLLSACDIGLIFLSKDFTVPNFPQRLLSFLEMRLPVITATDKVTDVGNIIEDAKCGFKIDFGDRLSFENKIEILMDNEELFKKMKNNSFHLLQEKYLVDYSYKKIIDHIL